MERKQIWILGGASLGLIFLFLWGTFRGGTAVELVPEPVKKESASSVLTTEDASEEPAQKYDASVSLRDRPLRDPFRLAAPGMVSVPRSAPSAALADDSLQAAPKALPAPARPTLRGTMVLGNDRRAVIDFGGKTLTVKEGEQVDTWQVTAISQKKVVLSGSAGDEVLSLS